MSYRTTASFERYNEGRRLWSQIILGSRTLARMIWFHVPGASSNSIILLSFVSMFLTILHAEMMPAAKDDPSTLEQRRSRVLIEKKTVINLIEAFGVAVKHYLRGEDGVYYVDLYHLVKYLPSYALPAGLPSLVDVTSMDGESTRSPPLRARGDSSAPAAEVVEGHPSDLSLPPASPKSPTFQQQQSQLPPPVTAAPGRSRKVSVQAGPPHPQRLISRSRTIDEKKQGDKSSTYSMHERDDFLLPARNPPKYHLLDLFPLSLLVGFLAKRGKEVKGKKAARIRAKLRSKTVTHNLPLEISLYLVSDYRTDH